MWISDIGTRGDDDNNNDENNNDCDEDDDNDNDDGDYLHTHGNDGSTDLIIYQKGKGAESDDDGPFICVRKQFLIYYSAFIYFQ